MFDREQVFKGADGKDIFRAPDFARESGMTRYRVSAANDPAEIDAEQKADEVMGGGLFRSEAPGASHGIYRSAESVGAEGGEVGLASADLSGMGSALPEPLQRSMESSFGTSFADVRVHTDAGADRASRDLSARAFTRGQDMYFRSGEYDPGSFEGQHLIAHELAHVASGGDGLHRVFEKPPMDSSAPASSLSEEERKKYYENRQAQIVAGVEKIKSAASTLIETNAKLSVRYGVGAQSEDFSREELEKSKSDLGDRGQIAGAAAEYAGFLDDYAEDYAVYQFEPESLQGNDPAQGQQGDLLTRLQNDSFYTMLRQKKTEVEAVRKQCDDSKSGIDATVALINALMNGQTSQNGSNEQEAVSADVINMVKSPWFDMFIKCIDELRGTRLELGAGRLSEMENALNSATNKQAMQPVQGEGLRTAQRASGFIGAAVDTASVGTDLFGNSSDLMVARDGENSHQQMQNDADVAGKTMSITSTVTSTADLALSAAQLHNKEAERERKAKALGVQVSSADHLSRLDVAAKGMGTASNVFSVTSSFLDSENGQVKESSTDITGGVLGFTGDVLGLASTDQKRRQQIKQAQTARRGMMPLAKQLRSSTNDTRPESVVMTGAAAKAEEVANNKDKSKPRDGKTLPQAVDDAMGHQDATSKQKSLLGSMKVLYASIKNSEGNAKDMITDTALSSIGLVGDISGLIASSLNAMDLGKAGGMAAAIFGMVGTVLGAIASSKGIVEGLTGVADASAGKDAAAEKTKITQSAIQQMMTLPYLNTEALKAAAAADNGKVSKSVNAAAERYAAVYSMIEAGNVEFGDILFAVHQGGFGGEGSVDEKMKKMYANLSFSNLDM